MLGVIGTRLICCQVKALPVFHVERFMGVFLSRECKMLRYFKHTCIFPTSRTSSIIQSVCVSTLAAGCTFDEDSDPNLCDLTQGEEDDFDWQLFRTHNAPHASADLLRGKNTALPFVYSYKIVYVVIQKGADFYLATLIFICFAR